jgi:predicted esterase
LGSAKKVFLGGFSQGACIALTSYLQFEGGVLGGVACLSGILCADINWKYIDVA